jgi:hypothetical protein
MAHGDAKMRRGVASMARKSVGCRENRSGCPENRSGCRIPPGRRQTRTGPGANTLDRPLPRLRFPTSRCPDPRPSPPPARDPPPARCRHRFPRSHGSSEHKVKTPWLTFRCPLIAGDVNNAEGTRNPGKSGRIGQRGTFALRRTLGTLADPPCPCDAPRPALPGPWRKNRRNPRAAGILVCSRRRRGKTNPKAAGIYRWIAIQNVMVTPPSTARIWPVT